MQDIQQHNFPLPKLGPKLASLEQEVVSGRGFTLLRHVPTQGLTQQQLMLLFWGIGQYWGAAVPQNAKGHMIGHVRVSLPCCLPVVMCPSQVPERSIGMGVTFRPCLPLQSLPRPAKLCCLVPAMLSVCNAAPQWLVHHVLALMAGLTSAVAMLCCRTAISTPATQASVSMPQTQLSHITQTALT